MMAASKTWAIVVGALAFAAAAAPAAAQIHTSELPRLTPETTFPRATARELNVAGFPDHMHEYHWVGWQTPVAPDGMAYGPGSLCENKAVLEVEGLVVETDEKRKGPFTLRHHPDYAACDMLPCLELLDWAGHTVPALLGLPLPGSLKVFNPDNVPHYTELTGQGTWRLYALEGDACTLQPFPVLESRTLAGHAAFMLVTDWLLSENIDQDLPPWLHQGIVEYIGEDGVHLVNYMVQFREEKAVLLSPPLIDALLSAGVDPDPDKDREMFRRACYSSFLMVWQLVENEGGLAALRQLLALAADGVSLDQAATEVYGMSLADLTVLLDPVRNGEPINDVMVSRRPHVQP